MLFCYKHTLKIHLGITKLLTRSGFKREDFLVTFSLFNVSDVEHFVARKIKLIEIDKALGSDSS